MSRISRVTAALLTTLLLALAGATGAQAATTVATMRVMSYGPGGTGGHSWIMIYNATSSSTLKVATYSLPPGKALSVGTWGNKPDGKGVYFNLERSFGSGAYPGRVSLSMNLSSAQLTTVSNKIKDSNSWSYTNNCSSFAEKVWNSVAPSSQQVSAGTVKTPTKLATNIKSKSGYGTNSSFTTAAASEVYRMTTATTQTRASSSSLGGSSSSG